MEFIIIGIVSLVVLGLIAALASRGDDTPIVTAGGCAGCDGLKEGCKLAELKQGKRPDGEPCHE